MCTLPTEASPEQGPHLPLQCDSLIKNLLRIHNCPIFNVGENYPDLQVVDFLPNPCFYFTRVIANACSAT